MPHMVYKTVFCLQNHLSYSESLNQSFVKETVLVMVQTDILFDMNIELNTLSFVIQGSISLNS